MDKHLRTAFMITADAIKPRGVFRGIVGSLRDFLDSQSDQNDPRCVAVSIFEYFCLEDECFNGFRAGVELAVGFLDKVLDGPEDEYQRVQSLRDLKAVLQTGSLGEILQWIDANYR